MSEKLTYEMILELFRETDKKIKELTADNIGLKTAMRELAESSKETDEKIREIAEGHKKLEVAQLKTDKQIKENGKQIGGLHRERGTYTEIILMPSIEDIIKNKFKLDSFDSNLKRTIKDDQLQIDAIGFTNSTRNEVLVVEVKTKLDKEDIEQLENHLKRLDYFFPEHKNKKKYGLLAAMSASKSLIEKVHQKGFYFALVKNDLLNMQNPEGFNAKEY